jgi:hypothetical protein
MDDKRFNEVKNELAKDVAVVVSALQVFAHKWKPRADEISTLTPEQDEELAKIADLMDVAFNGL